MAKRNLSVPLEREHGASLGMNGDRGLRLVWQRWGVGGEGFQLQSLEATQEGSLESADLQRFSEKLEIGVLM